MGRIELVRRAEDGKVIAEVLLTQEELRQLRGEMEDVCLFADRIASVPSKVSLRGRNDATQYFLIPRQLRKRLPVFGEVSCQRLDLAGRIVFIYVVDPYKRSRNARIAE